VRQFGARAFDLDIDTGTGVLLPPEGRQLRVSELEKAVENAGFELLGVELEVQGRLAHIRTSMGEELPAVKVEATGQVFVILEGDSDREHEAWAGLSPHFKDYSSVMMVRGRVHQHEEGPVGIFLNDFRTAD